MKYCALLALCLLIQECVAVPIGWSPNIPSDNSPKVHHGNLAGVASSTNPATIYSWLFHLFSQSSFLSWLGHPISDKIHGSVGQPVASSGKEATTTTTVASTTPRIDDVRLTAPKSMDLQVVRDFDDTARTSDLSGTQKPTVPEIARDFEAANVPVIQRTFSPVVNDATQPPINQRTVGINLPIVILGGPNSDRLVEGDTTTARIQTQTPRLTIIRDFAADSNAASNQGQDRLIVDPSNPGSGSSTPDLNLKGNDELKVERDFATSNQGSSGSLTIIRDTMDDKSLESNKALTKDAITGGNSKPEVSGLVVLNPFDISKKIGGVR